MGNTLYFTNGVDAQKYYSNGSTYVTQLMGISIGSQAGADGPQVPGTITQVGSPAWTNPANIASTSVFATVTVPTGAPGVSGTLTVTNLGMTVPAGSVITGIQISIKASATVAPGFLAQIVAALNVNGNTVGNAIGTQITTSPTVYTLGSPTNLWGANLSAANVDDISFGFTFGCLNYNGVSSTFSCNSATVTVFFSGPPLVTPTGSGTMAAVNGGYQYEVCYGNGSIVPPVVSSPTLPSNRTGNFTGKQYVGIPVVASTDPQTTQIRVFRTTDGGSIFFELSGSPFPNTSTTIHDNDLDPGAVGTGTVLNQFSNPPAQHESDPPPPGLINLCYHLGRIWGSVGNTVYYSDGADNPFNGAEAFPRANNFVMPSLVTKLVPLTIGLLIFTTTGLHFSGIGGTNNDTPTVPTLFLAGKVSGLLGYNALEVVGSTIYLVASNRKCLQIDISTGLAELGFPIGDVLTFGNGTFPGINPATCYVAWHEQDSTDSGMYLCQPGAAATAWRYRLNPTPSPETGMCWATLAVDAAGFSAVQSIETAPGVHKLLLGPPVGGTGPILFRDPTNFADNAATYPAYGDIGSIVLVHPGQVALVDFITTDCIAVGSRPTVKVLLGEIGGHASMLLYGQTLSVASPDPPELGPAETNTIYNDRWWRKREAQAPAMCRHMQIEIGWPAENQPNELLSYAIFGAHYQEL